MRAWLAARLPQVWLQRRWPALLLWPLSLLYGAVASLRRWLYRFGLLASGSAGVPVIVVGNVVAGGSGKTPVVIAIVEHLKAAGWQVGVVSRGYGRVGEDCREVLPDSPVRQVGDEPALIRHTCRCPVFVAPKRLDAARALLAQHPGVQIIVCDDGLQHLALERDIEICVFDDRGAGNGLLLPAGPLREPWPRAVDLVLHTGEHPAFGGWRARRGLAADALAQDGTRRPLQSFAGTPCTVLAGIARPEAFFAMLHGAGITPARTIALPDHFDFASWQLPAGTPTPVLCTEKDAVKLWSTVPEAWAVPLQLVLDAGFADALDRLVAARVPSRLS